MIEVNGYCCLLFSYKVAIYLASMAESLNFQQRVLGGGIDRTLDDTGKTEISKKTLEGYGGPDWSIINQALAEWETRGILKIIKDPEQARSEEIVIKMLCYIGSGARPAWLFGYS